MSSTNMKCPFDEQKITKNIYDYPIDDNHTLHKIKITDTQFDELKSNVKNLDKLTNVYTKVIVGGSRALKIWTNRDFNVDDNDIFLHSIAGNRFTGGLEKDIDKIKEIFPNCEVLIKLSKDNVKSVVNETESTEEFDQSIIGTINLKYENTKYQFVMIERRNFGFSYSNDLIGWYGRTTDLPVFILYDKFEPMPNFIVKHGYGHWLAKEGILTSLRHENRIEKYGKKGFKFLNFTTDESILSEKTLYSSNIDMNKYNSNIEE